MLLLFERFRITALALCLFFATWGAKLAIINRFGSDLPVWDVWMGEAYTVFLPYLQGHLGFWDLFQPHNEHRIVWTKLLGLGLLLVNGQWDPRLECIFSATLHSATATAAFVYGAKLLPRIFQYIWFIMLAVLIGLPVAWHNVISAFHSQQYFLLTLSLLTLVFLLPARVNSWQWWTGLICGLFALGTQASGFLAATAVALTLIIQIRSGSSLRRHWVTIILCTALTVAGVLLAAHVEAHDGFRAHTIKDFSLASWRNLQWPVTGFPLYPLLGWAPWAILSWKIIRSKSDVENSQRTLFAVGLWALLQFAAVSYGRGATGPWPANRYLETTVVGICANAFIALHFLSRPFGASRKWWGTLSAATLSLFIWGFAHEMTETISKTLPEVQAINQRREFNARAYLATGDRKFIEGPDIPFPGIIAFLEFLSHPEIVDILPVSIRRPLTLSPAKSYPDFNATSADLTNSPAMVPSWGSSENAEGQWQSKLLPPAKYRYWQFWTIGEIGDAQLTLDLMGSNGTKLTRIVPLDPSSRTWSQAIVLGPHEPSILIASDATSTKRMAFTEPREMALGSYIGWRLVCHGFSILAVFSGIFVAIAATDFYRQRPPRIAPGNNI